MTSERNTHPLAPVNGPGQTLFDFVRHWSRRWNIVPDNPAAQNGRHVLVVEAVRAVSSRGPATINCIAREIGFDQSGASRLVRDAVAAGYLRLEQSEVDGRERHALLTLAGIELIVAAHSWQEDVFARLTQTWSPRQRTAFHAAIGELLERSRTFKP